MPTVPPPPAEGLRARKKRETRQHIADTATALFFERGFDAVRVAEVASASGVSEKTVFNYFPTKEALLLDREDAMADALRRALGPDQPPGSPSPIGAVVAEIDAELTRTLDGQAGGGRGGRSPAGGSPAARTLSRRAVEGLRRFGELVEGTPSLRAAQLDMTSRLAQVAAVALADRAGVDARDPEPQMMATAIVGLWKIQFHALARHGAPGRSTSDVHHDVMAEVRRAADVAEGGLWSFGAAVQGATTRRQFNEAADAVVPIGTRAVRAIRSARTARRPTIGEA